ncbi:transferrin-binding protein-like solute binding protein [Neisseria animaloris]|uniref:transferrin-binding protein-like solute binding protein n=1 Tax=Neisseria animaloris TaxID=326522 RepID=UPI000D30BCC4|nr:hypothetical protein [Neisseria animaloris]
MKTKLRVNGTLTLLTMLTLSACGSGGGKAPETMPSSKPTQKVAQKTLSVPKVGEQKGKSEQVQVNSQADKSQENKPSAKEKTQVKQPEGKSEAKKTQTEQSVNPKNNSSTQEIKADKFEEKKTVDSQVKQKPTEETKVSKPQIEQLEPPKTNPSAQEVKADKPKEEKLVEPILTEESKVSEPQAEQPTNSQMKQPAEEVKEESKPKEEKIAELQAEKPSEESKESTSEKTEQPVDLQTQSSAKETEAEKSKEEKTAELQADSSADISNTDTESRVKETVESQSNQLVDSPKVDTPQAEKTELDKLQQPLAQSLNDKEVFERLVPYAKNGVVDGNLVKLVLNDNNRKVELTVLDPHSFVGTPKIETLRDSTGALVGYYGYARVAEQKQDLYKDKYVTLHDLYLQYADQSLQQRPVSMGDINYNGKMLYQYHADPRQLEATVSATYFVGEKKLKMDIHDKDGGLWTLHERRASRSNNHVSVNEDGSIGGYLFFHNNQSDKPSFNGNFSGGFYGKDGSVLTGRASYEDRENGWEGVIGATAEKADKSKP